jgi:hypothetical protein
MFMFGMGVEKPDALSAGLLLLDAYQKEVINMIPHSKNAASCTGS